MSCADAAAAASSTHSSAAAHQVLAEATEPDLSRPCMHKCIAVMRLLSLAGHGSLPT